MTHHLDSLPSQTEGKLGKEYHLQLIQTNCLTALQQEKDIEPSTTSRFALELGN